MTATNYIYIRGGEEFITHDRLLASERADEGTDIQILRTEVDAK